MPRPRQSSTTAAIAATPTTAEARVSSLGRPARPLRRRLATPRCGHACLPSPCDRQPSICGQRPPLLRCPDDDLEDESAHGGEDYAVARAKNGLEKEKKAEDEDRTVAATARRGGLGRGRGRGTRTEEVDTLNPGRSI